MTISAAGQTHSKLSSIATNTNLLNVINGSRGTQITKSHTTSAIGGLTLHTVTAAKTFYLTAVTLSVKPVDTSVNVKLVIKDTENSIVYTIMRLHSTATHHSYSETINFKYPIAIPAGYKVETSLLVGGTTTVFIHGWEE